RRHTRFSRDWSSDVCSSDLLIPLGADHHVGRVGLQWKLLVPALKPPDPGADPTRHLEHWADRVDADHLPRLARRPGDKARGDPRAACDDVDRLSGPDVGRLVHAPSRGLAVVAAL